MFLDEDLDLDTNPDHAPEDEVDDDYEPPDREWEPSPSADEERAEMTRIYLDLK